MQRLGRRPDPRSRGLLRNKRLVEERSDFPDMQQQQLHRSGRIRTLSRFERVGARALEPV